MKLPFLGFFKKDKQGQGAKIDLYVTEIQNTNVGSQWRKPNLSFINDPYLKKRQLIALHKTNTVLLGCVIVCSVMLFFGVIKFVFFTNFETVYLDDASYHTCIVDDYGVRAYGQ